MDTEPTFDFEWVRSSGQLAQVAERLLGEPHISIDTETAGWQTGNEQLCLIQIGVPSNRMVYLVDVVEAGAPVALAPVLLAPTPLIIAHNAAFEERQFGRYDLKVRGVRDTLTMARQLRPDLPNHTLRTCCRLLLGIVLSKEQQTSDWAFRPLSDAQVRYARLDAEVALTLYDYLVQLEERASAEMAAEVPELMSEYADLIRRRYNLTASISHELAFLQAREEKVRETLRQRLIEGAPAYDGPIGSAHVTKVKRTEVNPEKVRQLFPEFAPEVIQEHVDRRRFDTVARERGLPKNAIEMVLDTIGFNERLYVTVKDDEGAVE